MTAAVDRARDALRDGNVVAIVGAGVTRAAAPEATTAGWEGLLRSGAQHVVDAGCAPNDGWLDFVLHDIEYALANNDGEGLITAGEKIVDALGGLSSTQFRSWLTSDVGGLQPEQPAILNAIADVGIPLATTNYDDLLEIATGQRHVTWRSPADVVKALRGDDPAIVHLHGHWREPESIVLSSSSYATIVGDTATQAILNSTGVLKTILFIGVGAGADDPNFERFRKWLAEVLPGGAPLHYRLCRDADVGQLNELHRGEPISPLAYGSDHSDLIPFLQSLRDSTPAAIRASMAVASTEQPLVAAEALLKQIQARSLVVQDHAAPDVPLDRMLIPPVLLPMPHDQFIQLRLSDNEPKPERCDPAEEAGRDQWLVVAGDENSGLTSTLEWLVYTRSTRSQDVLPVCVDFKSLTSGSAPLERAVRRQLADYGIGFDKRKSLPPCVVALDNMTAGPRRIVDRALDELPLLSSGGLVVIGCRQGTEHEVCKILEAKGHQVTVRYLGRLNGGDVKRMAQLIDPLRAGRVAASILQVTSQEHLPRTPQTVALLAGVLQHGEHISLTVSQTALLDAYVQLLLGRGDPHNDARFNLDVEDRADILATLAEKLARDGVGELTQEEAVGCLEAYFDIVGWDESAIDVLKDLEARRVITVGRHVRFNQHTFLHLFAAKRASTSDDFRVHLLGRPLYYSPIIRHYAALVRRDTEVLEAVAKLLDSEPLPSIIDGSMFAVDETTSGSSTSELGRLVAQLDEIEARGARSDEDQDSSASDIDRWEDLDLDDPAPFPLEDIENTIPIARLATALELVSNVLRDSDLVTDQPLKRSVLRQVLFSWGHLAELLDNDPTYREFIDRFTVEIADELGLTGASRDNHIEHFTQDITLMITVGGVWLHLATRKLVQALRACFDEPELLADPRSSVMGAFLALAVHDSGWADLYGKAAMSHRETSAVRNTMHRTALAAYRYQRMTSDDEASLKRLLIEQNAKELANTPEGKSERSRLAQQLDRVRLLGRRNRLPAGSSVITEAPSDDEADSDPISDRDSTEEASPAPPAASPPLEARSPVGNQE